MPKFTKKPPVGALTGDEIFPCSQDGGTKRITLAQIIAHLPKPVLFKGGIAEAGDFPTTADVQAGWMYKCMADVTDDDVTKTNTGQSFLSGAEIVWDGIAWLDFGNEDAFLKKSENLADLQDPEAARANLGVEGGGGEKQVNFLYVDHVFEGTLADVTYDNGTNGEGATLTTNTNVAYLPVAGMSMGDRMLVMDHVPAAERGIYALTQIGSASETYHQELITLIGDVTTWAGKYWELSTPSTEYYVWYNVDGGNSDPAVSGRTGIEVALTSSDTAASILSKTVSTINTVLSADIYLDSADGTSDQFMSYYMSPGALLSPTASGNLEGGTFAVSIVTLGGSPIPTVFTRVTDFDTADDMPLDIQTRVIKDVDEYLFSPAYGTSEIVVGTTSLFFSYLRLRYHLNSFSMLIGSWNDGGTPPAAVTTLSSTNSIKIRDFQGETAAQDVLNTWIVPLDAISGTLQFRVRCMVSDPAGITDKGIAFKLELGKNGLDSAMGENQVSSASGITKVQYKEIVTDWSDGFAFSAGGLILMRLSRDIDNILDTYTGSIGVYAVEFKYYANTNISLMSE